MNAGPDTNHMNEDRGLGQTAIEHSQAQGDVDHGRTHKAGRQRRLDEFPRETRGSSTHTTLGDTQE